MVKLVLGTEPVRVELQAEWVGPDLVVSIGGGTRAHVGAVAVAQPRPSLKGDGKVSATASVIALVGHKEDELARWAALHLASQLNTTVVVTAGLHIDDADPDQIQHMDAYARELVTQIAYPTYHVESTTGHK